MLIELSNTYRIAPENSRFQSPLPSSHQNLESQLAALETKILQKLQNSGHAPVLGGETGDFVKTGTQEGFGKEERKRLDEVEERLEKVEKGLGDVKQGLVEMQKDKQRVIVPISYDRSAQTDISKSFKESKEMLANKKVVKKVQALVDSQTSKREQPSNELPTIQKQVYIKVIF